MPTTPPSPEAIIYTGSKPLTISGGGATELFEIENNIVNNETSPHVTLSGLVFTGGLGGQWRCHQQLRHLTIDNSTVESNTATSVGGAIQNEHGATLIVSGSTISGNTAVQAGSGQQSRARLCSRIRRSRATRRPRRVRSTTRHADGERLDPLGQHGHERPWRCHRQRCRGQPRRLRRARCSPATLPSEQPAAVARSKTRASLTITDSTVSANTAAASGGGIGQLGACSGSSTARWPATRRHRRRRLQLSHRARSTRRTARSRPTHAAVSGGAIANLATASTDQRHTCSRTAPPAAAVHLTTGTFTAVNTTIAYNTVARIRHGGGLDVVGRHDHAV